MKLKQVEPLKEIPKSELYEQRQILLKLNEDESLAKNAREAAAVLFNLYSSEIDYRLSECIHF